jgi:putative oxidoreductase
MTAITAPRATPTTSIKLLATTGDPAITVVRIVLGLVMLPHGLQKALGWFGGGGIEGTLGFFSQMGVPTVLGVLAIAAEFLGSLGLIFGLATRVAAFGILANMIVATLTVHLPFGFFMNWFGSQQGEGYEYHLLAGAMALFLVLRGGGKASLDRVLAGR